MVLLGIDRPGARRRLDVRPAPRPADRGGPGGPRRRPTTTSSTAARPGHRPRPDGRGVERVHQRRRGDDRQRDGRHDQRRRRRPSTIDAPPPQRVRRDRRACRPGRSRPRPRRSPASRTPRRARRRSSSRSARSTTTARRATRPTPTSARGNGDVPISELDFAWTNFGTGNVNTSEVSDIIDGTTTINKTLDLRRVHRPAQQRQPHRPVRRRRQVPERAWTSPSRSSTRTGTSWAGRRST